MAASYPSSIVSFTNRSDGDVVDNTHVNALQDEITAVETTLGTGLTSISAANYSSIATSFTSLTSRLNNLDAGVSSTDPEVHPQYFLKKGGTIQPTAGNVASLIVIASPDRTNDAIFKVQTEDTHRFIVWTTGGTTTVGSAEFTKGVVIEPDTDVQSTIWVNAPSTYSGPALRVTRGGAIDTAVLDAVGNLTLTGDLTVGGNVTFSGSMPQHTHGDSTQGGRVIPAGVLMPYAGSGSIPAGWLLCDGQTVSRATYSDLFTAIGVVYGAGDGSTTFQVPNLKGRVPVGRDASQAEFSAVGLTGGSKSAVSAHTHGITHTHNGNTGAMSTNATHSHTQAVNGYGSGGTVTSQVVHASSNSNATATPSTANSNTDHNHSFTTGGPSDSTSTSTGTASGNLQPFLTVSYLIKV